MNNQKGFVPVVVAIIVAVLALGFAGTAVYYEMQKDDVETIIKTDLINTNIIANTNTVVDETADWQTYTNEDYGFSFKFPSEWIKEEDNIMNSATDVIFGIGNNNPLIVRVYYGFNDGHGGETYFGAVRNAQIIYTAGVADEFVFPNGNGFGQTIPYITERFINNEVVYAFEFNGVTDLTSQDTQILNSLKFTN